MFAFRERSSEKLLVEGQGDEIYTDGVAAIENV